MNRTPALEKLPIRSIVVAPKDHYLVNFDLAQAESWVVAYLANEPTMKHVLQTGDLHRETAQHAFAEVDDVTWGLFDKVEVKARRYTGKRFNHASAYRMSPSRAAEVINKDSDKPPFVVVTVAESKVFYQKWHSYYHIKGWWDEIERELGQTRTLITPYGRLRYFFAQWGNDLFKEATAYVPQSTVADHMNGCVQDELGIEGGVLKVDEFLVQPGHIRIINQSHDSILCEVPKTSALDICQQIVTLLQRPLVVNGEQFTIPVDCEVGERWGELKEQHRDTGSYEIKYSF